MPQTDGLSSNAKQILIIAAMLLIVVLIFLGIRYPASDRVLTHHITYKGHSYITYAGGGITHDPDCPHLSHPKAHSE